MGLHNVNQSFIFLWLLFMISVHLPNTNAAEYVIKTSWNNMTIVSSDQVIINLEKHDADSFKIVVQAPFYDDPPPNTPGDVGEPKWGLWDFELVKIFFLNDLHQYIEIQLGAWGHHFVLLLNGYRHTIRFGMLINYKADRSGKRWNGTAIIPLTYLPVNASKLNVFSYHGSRDKRVVNALYPVENIATAELDDHKLPSFQPFDSTVLFTEDFEAMSSVWTDALQGIRSFQIATSWKGKELLSNETVDLHVQLDASRTNLILNVSAPFYNDPAPEKTNGGPFADLYKYEVVHLYLLGYPDLKYLEIQLGPWGHYLVVFWNGYYNKVGSLDSPLKYSFNRFGSHWNGSATIPLTYLPPRVYLMNAHSTHGVDEKRQWNSLYPVPEGSNQSSPDYHNLKNYKFVDLTELYPENDDTKCSQTWQALNVCPNSAVQSQTGVISLVILNAILVLLLNM